MHVDAGDAGRDVDVELVEVDVVAAPGEGVAVGREEDAGDGVRLAGGGVVAGDPLRGDEASVRSAVILMGVFWAKTGTLSVKKTQAAALQRSRFMRALFRSGLQQ
jgi:hypothetical protein